MIRRPPYLSELSKTYRPSHTVFRASRYLDGKWSSWTKLNKTSYEGQVICQGSAGPQTDTLSTVVPNSSTTLGLYSNAWSSGQRGCCQNRSVTFFYGELMSISTSQRFQNFTSTFVTSKGESSVNFRFWWKCVEMVSLLFVFQPCPERGNWELYLFIFKCILPFFMRYDHTNYARWGAI